MTTFRVGQNARSPHGPAGKIIERLTIEDGWEAAPGGKVKPRVDLRIEYTDAQGKRAEALIHEEEAVKA